jgi:uncharacterized protein
LDKALAAIPQNEPLTDAELERLGQFLKNCKSGKAMNLEELDGFFTALIAGPEIVTPSEYMSDVFGRDTSQGGEFETIEEAQEILGLLMRHWNDIAGTLASGGAHLPLVAEDTNGFAQGNDWARGFIRGTRKRHEGWAELLADDDHGGCMIPALMLYHEHDEDPAMRPNPITPEQREKLIVRMAAGLVSAYRYFRQSQHLGPSTQSVSVRSERTRIGRNDPCPCGSGKKYKRCCGGMTVH